MRRSTMASTSGLGQSPKETTGTKIKKSSSLRRKRNRETDHRLRTYQEEPFAFLIAKLCSLPVLRMSANTLSDWYHDTKDRLSSLNFLFNGFEKMVTLSIGVAIYISTPLANIFGGWRIIDRWSCRLVDKIEQKAPIISKQPNEIKRILKERLDKWLHGVSQNEQNTELQFNPTDNYESKIRDAMESGSSDKTGGLDSTGSSSLDKDFTFMSKDDIEKLDPANNIRSTPRKQFKDESRQDSDQELTEAEISTVSVVSQDSSILPVKPPWYKTLFQRRRAPPNDETSSFTSQGEDTSDGGSRSRKSDYDLKVKPKEPVKDREPARDKAGTAPTIVGVTLKDQAGPSRLSESFDDNNKSSDTRNASLSRSYTITSSGTPSKKNRKE